jgi:copper chaperone CopZ
MNAVVFAVLALLPAAEPQTFKCRVTGLFNHEREADLREAVQKMTDVTVVSIDFDVAEVTFSYDPEKLFQKGTKEKDRLERFDNLLRNASNHTFAAKPLFTTPKDKLTRIEITVSAPDCKGCCLGVYQIVANIDGVEQATVDLKSGQVTALIDPSKTGKAALETALKKREVKVKG